VAVDVVADLALHEDHSMPLSSPTALVNAATASADARAGK
jgi:hypothetical protein